MHTWWKLGDCLFGVQRLSLVWFGNTERTHTHHVETTFSDRVVDGGDDDVSLFRRSPVVDGQTVDSLDLPFIHE